MANELVRIKNVKNVLEEALNCFNNYGIEETKIVTIAKAAGVTSRSVYRYFGTKENLVLQVAIDFLNKGFGTVEKHIAKKNFQEKNGLKQVEDFFNLQIKYFKEEPADALMLKEFEVFLRKHADSEELMTVYVERFNERKNILEMALQKGIDDGTIRNDIDLDLVSRTLAVSFAGVLQRIALYYSNKKMRKVVKADELLAEFNVVVEYYLKK